ncbi:MAG TPA: UDP-N-acetylmuramate--L-alanine ligase, partial [Cellvibrionaceae bacterium]|nr:UDP-N-acetylmuramate--L-alanine ligase [Cellvibrionaceae bacterium]
IRNRGSVDPVFVEQVDGVLDVLKPLLRPDDIVITQGAGNVGSLAAILANNLMQ